MASGAQENKKRGTDRMRRLKRHELEALPEGVRKMYNINGQLRSEYRNCNVKGCLEPRVKSRSYCRKHQTEVFSPYNKKYHKEKYKVIKEEKKKIERERYWKKKKEKFASLFKRTSKE